MKPRLRKKELISMFMESPLYFDLLVRERLELLKDHERRSSRRVPLTGIATLVNSVQVDPTVHVAMDKPSPKIAAPQNARLIVGYMPPKSQVGV